MKRIGKYWAIFKTQILNTLAYPGELAWRSLSIILFLWVFANLWRVTYRAEGSGTLNGISLKDMLWYLMLAETIELGKPRLARVMADAVKDGSVAYLLNKPYHFILYHLSTGMGESLVRGSMTALFGGAIVWLMMGPPPDPRGWPLAAAGVLGAWLLHFCVNALIGLAAFVSEEVAPYEWIYQKLAFILGGLFIPLDLYPLWLQNIARYLPFAYMLYGPARLFIAPDIGLFLNVLGGQIFWLAVLGGLLFFFYSRGMRRLAINGG
jgi:ABC-2 type transport system permease protein